MKIIAFLFLVIVLSSVKAWGFPTLVFQSSTAATGFTVSTATINCTLTNKDALIALLTSPSGALSPTALFDTQGDTFTLIYSLGTGINEVDEYLAFNLVGGISTVTFLNNGTTASLGIYEYSGALSTATPFDVKSTNTGTGTSGLQNSGVVTTRANQEVTFWTCSQTGGSCTVAGGGTALLNVNNIIVAQKNLAIAGSIEAQYNITVTGPPWWIGIATYAPGGIITTACPSMEMLGVGCRL